MFPIPSSLPPDCSAVAGLASTLALRCGCHAGAGPDARRADCRASDGVRRAACCWSHLLTGRIALRGPTGAGPEEDLKAVTDGRSTIRKQVATGDEERRSTSREAGDSPGCVKVRRPCSLPTRRRLPLLIDPSPAAVTCSAAPVCDEQLWKCRPFLLFPSTTFPRLVAFSAPMISG